MIASDRNVRTNGFLSFHQCLYDLFFSVYQIQLTFELDHIRIDRKKPFPVVVYSRLKDKCMQRF